MAILIDMSKDHGLQVDQPTECATDVERGLSVMTKPGPVIEVSLYDWNAAEPWRETLEITTRQVRELGQWLCRRARLREGRTAPTLKPAI